MQLYGQDAELHVLGAVLKRLDNRSVIDVGAERGDVAETLLRAGAEELHAIDPHPGNARTLSERFDSDPRVKVHEYAISDRDESFDLHESSRPDGTPLTFGHTLVAAVDTAEIAWRDTISVSGRSLDSLVSTGELPPSTGILKVDTEGHDMAVIRGMGALQPNVVMVEHWTDLPLGLGRCPWTTSDMIAALRPRGFTHFIFVIHRGEFVTLKWDDGDIERGAMGNLVFLHDDIVARVLPDILTIAGSLAEAAVEVGQANMQAANDRMDVIRELERVAERRLALIHELEATANQHLAQVVRHQELLAGCTEELRQARDRIEALEGRRAGLRLDAS